jgi:hypothetical protein
MATLTSNYGWLKPDIGGDDDQWGVQLNSDLDGIDSTVKNISTLANNKVGEAPIDNNLYARQNGLWSVIIGSGGGASVTISPTPPTAPHVGNLWWDATGGNLYIWYSSTSSAAWVDVVGGGAVPITPPAGGSQWDGGASTWDGGATTWD